MPGLGDYPRYMHRPQRYPLLVSVALALGFGAYASINRVLTEPAWAALLTVCAMVLVGIFFVLQHVQALQAEIVALHAREKLLKVQAHHDNLTGLANRMLLADRFHLAVERAKRNDRSFALLMIDLNEFKNVNDRYGHVAGDAVLVSMARRLVAAVRASDTVARLGGDEFVLLIESVDDPYELTRLGQKLCDSLAETITLDTGVVLTVGASVGLAIYPQDAAGLNDLLCVADQAMYECKSTGLMSLQ